MNSRAKIFFIMEVIAKVLLSTKKSLFCNPRKGRYSFFQIFAITCINLSALLICCSTDQIAGSGSQTTNGVTVALLGDTISIKARPGLKTMVISLNYNPLFLSGLFKDEITNDSGKSIFTKLDSGYYNVIVEDTSSDSAVLFAKLKIPSGNQESVFTDYLMQTGSISGFISDSLSKTPVDSLAVILSGTPYVSSVTPSGRYHFDNIPKGNYLLVPYSERAKSTNAWGSPVNVTVESGKETKVSN